MFVSKVESNPIYMTKDMNVSQSASLWPHPHGLVPFAMYISIKVRQEESDNIAAHAYPIVITCRILITWHIECCTRMLRVWYVIIKMTTKMTLDF